MNCSESPPQPPPVEIPRLINPCLTDVVLRSSLILSAGVSQPFASLPFCNASLSVEQRITDAVQRMQLSEKIAAMATTWPALPGLGLPAYDWWSEATHGVSYYRVDAKTPFSTNFGKLERMMF